jgi:hypothetical protein
MSFDPEAFSEFLLGHEFRGAMTSRSVRKQVETVQEGHVSPPEDDMPIESGKGYFRFWLVTMFLKYDREWFRERFPAVHSNIRFEFGDDSVELANVVSTATMLSVNQGDAGSINVQNRPLTPLVPFNGGTIDLKVGLVSMKGMDVLANFTSAMDDITKSVATSELSTVLKSLDIINAGIGKLFDTDRDVLRVGHAESFTSDENRLLPGYAAIINQPDDSVNPDHLWVMDDTLMVGRYGLEDATPFDAADYILLRIETAQERDDWRNLSRIKEPFDKALLEIGKVEPGDDSTIADGFIRTAILNAYTSPELSREQRPKVCKTIRDEYREAKGVLETPLETSESNARGLAGDRVASSRPPSLRQLLSVD